MNAEREAEIEVLNKKIGRLQNQRQRLVDAETKETSLPELRKTVGKCFRFTNSYGQGEDWPLYARVISLNEAEMSFQTVQFQHTSRKIVEIEYEKRYNWRGQDHFARDSWTEIPLSEYNEAKRKALKFVQTLLEK